MTRSAFTFRFHELSPRVEDGELAGLEAGGHLLPFPGVGLETELGVVVPGASGQVQAALTSVLRQRTGLPPADLAGVDTWTEADREFDDLGSTYREGDHYELNTWYRRAAAGARSNLELLLERAGGHAASSGENVLLHATGGDGQGHSWSSLHVNVGISRRCYEYLLASHRAGRIAYDWYLPAQITLAVVDGNGGVGRDGFLISDRLPEFDRVFGACTLRPSRAMLVERNEHFGNARIMNMLRALSFGRASVAGLAATQLDCLITDLAVHGLLEVPRLGFDDPVQAAAELSRLDRVHEAMRIQCKVQRTRRRVLDELLRRLDDEVVDVLLPGVAAELDFIDGALDAVARSDDAEVVRCCDWARKLAIMQEFLRARGGEWTTSWADLLALNVHYARLDDQALRHSCPEAAMPATHRAVTEPSDTSSWLLWWLVTQAETDEAWREEILGASLSWRGIGRAQGSWVQPVGGYWPWARRQVDRIELVPWQHTRGRLLSEVMTASSLDDLFAALGETEARYGDYSGRALQPADPSDLSGDLSGTWRPERN